MTGEPVTTDWRGSLANTTYRYGGTLEKNEYARFFLVNSEQIAIHFDHRRTVEIRSFNRRERRNTYNVIGIMKGNVEPGDEIVCSNSSLPSRITCTALQIVMWSLVIIGEDRSIVTIRFKFVLLSVQRCLESGRH